jgi:hypothetical protein
MIPAQAHAMNSRDSQIATAIWGASASKPERPLPVKGHTAQQAPQPHIMRLKGYSVPRCYKPFEELFR